MTALACGSLWGRTEFDADDFVEAGHEGGVEDDVRVEQNRVSRDALGDERRQAGGHVYMRACIRHLLLWHAFDIPCRRCFLYASSTSSKMAAIFCSLILTRDMSGVRSAKNGAMRGR